jgi:hypothetical protein
MPWGRFDRRTAALLQIRASEDSHVDLGESVGINRYGAGDERALQRRSSQSRWPRVMRWRPARAQRSVDRGRAGGAIEPRNDIDSRVPTSSPWRKARLLAALCASRWWTLRGQRSQARTTNSMHENREISWSPAGVGDAPSWMVRGVVDRRRLGREGNA